MALLFGLNDTEGLVENEENFRALLKFRIDSGDEVSEHHLTIAKKNSTCISKTLANELIKQCGNEILSILLENIFKTKYYYVVIDKTTSA